MDSIDYDGRLSAVYHQGRALPQDGMAAWMRALSRRSPSQRPLVVLDLGSGTGRFAPWLAETFGGPVYGVEPAAGMRRVATAEHTHPRVHYLGGSAERIPLRDASCDLAVLFLVLHHLRDRRAAAAELARVLRPGGRLLLRSGFSDRLPPLLWHRWFPSARAIEQAVFPTLETVTAEFAAAGMRARWLDRVEVPIAPSLAAYGERLRLRPYSTFEAMTEREIRAGFAALDAAVAEEAEPRPVVERADLLVLAREP